MGLLDTDYQRYWKFFNSNTLNFPMTHQRQHKSDIKGC